MYCRMSYVVLCCLISCRIILYCAVLSFTVLCSTSLTGILSERCGEYFIDFTFCVLRIDSQFVAYHVLDYLHAFYLLFFFFLFFFLPFLF